MKIHKPLKQFLMCKSEEVDLHINMNKNYLISF